MEITHIIPLNDLREHSEETINHIGLLVSYCECSPRLETITKDSCMFIHNSFDGREGLELANEILNKI